MKSAITEFRSSSPAPEYDHPREERRLVGNPQRTTWNHFTNASGEVSAGDALVIPAGFKGVFEVVEPVRKHYVIVDRAAAAA